MKASDLYGAQPIKLDTFSSIESITGYITGIERKRFDTGEKLVATVDDTWSLVINATSYRVIRSEYGDETDDWVGQPITAYKGTLYYNGSERDGICVRIPVADPPPAAKAPATAELFEGGELATVNAELQEIGGALKDDIPF